MRALLYAKDELGLRGCFAVGFLNNITRLFSGDDRRPPAPSTPLTYRQKSLDDHFNPEGPKRILALDGGGVRGAMSIAVLERVEAILSDRHGNHPDFRLCDYFDLIGGTSTGSIIAGGLAAKRFSAADIKDFYFDMGPRIFRASPFRWGLSRAKFDANQLRGRLRSVFGTTELGSKEVATGLGVITKRADTDSTWVLHNHPNGKFFDTPADHSFVGNRHYPLRNVIRASTAAPHYFKPERIEIIKGEADGLFVDGAMSPHNNPSFQLLMLAGMNGYGFNWTLAPDRLLMISVGTGSSARTREVPRFDFQPQVSRTVEALKSMITSNEDFIETLMQWVAHSPDPKVIDSELGDLASDFLAGTPLLQYQRYQSFLTGEKLNEEYGLSLSKKDVECLRSMADPKCLPIAYEVGQAMAEKLVKPEHFPASFDLEMR